MLSQGSGWVAYVAPTRALVSQITRRLRRDLGPSGIRVEELTSAVEIDEIEAGMLNESPFDVLVAMFEMLPPQRIAIQEQGLLDPASAAVVVDLPTSAGKTILAEFKIVQAIESRFRRCSESRGRFA